MSERWVIAWEYRDERFSAVVNADGKEQALETARYCALSDFNEQLQVHAYPEPKEPEKGAHRRGIG